MFGNPSRPTEPVNFSGCGCGNGRVLFSAERGGPPHLFVETCRQAVNENCCRLSVCRSPMMCRPTAVPSFTACAMRPEQRGLWVAPLEEREVGAVSGARFSQSDLRFAPDGRHVTLSSNEAGRPEIYAASWPNLEVRQPVSSGGGSMGRWSRDGTEIFYLSSDRRLMSVRIRSTNPLNLAPPQEVFSLAQAWRAYEPARADRFLAIVPRLSGNAQPLTVVLNWIPGPSRRRSARGSWRCPLMREFDAMDHLWLSRSRFAL